MSLTLDNRELNLIRQWFDSVQDVNPNFLEIKDYNLASKIYINLGIRVPKSIMQQLNKSQEIDLNFNPKLIDKCKKLLCLPPYEKYIVDVGFAFELWKDFGETKIKDCCDALRKGLIK